MNYVAPTILRSFTKEKYLGVYMNHDLKWDHHINSYHPRLPISLGSSGGTSVVLWLSGRKVAYIAPVRWGVEYVSLMIIWYPYTTSNMGQIGVDHQCDIFARTTKDWNPYKLCAAPKGWLSCVQDHPWSGGGANGRL